MRLLLLLECLAVFVLCQTNNAAKPSTVTVPEFIRTTMATSTTTSSPSNVPVRISLPPPAKQAQFPGVKGIPRDCSDAPDKNIKHSCLMNYRMDQMTRSRIRRQAMLLSAANAASPLSPSLRARARARARALRRQLASNRVTTASAPTEAPAPTPQDARTDGSPMWQQPVPVPPFARGQAAYHPYDCMTNQCLCPFFRGSMINGTCYLGSGTNNPLTMAYRKEYRMMTDNERNRWHSALNTLKRNGEYDVLSRQHLDVGVASGAHSGPGFLPWHREYLKRVEIALRMVDPTVSIPYWDSVMDNYLMDPRDSMMFTNMFAGETDGWGNVVQGPFAYWPTLEGRGNILRNLGQEGQLFTEAQINNVVMQSDIEYVMAYTAPLDSCPYPNNWGAVEYIHSNIHLWIGGDMKPPSTSANEPIFFMHHAFVDYMWELWRQLRQAKWYREQAYTPDVPACANQLHHSYAPMRPFPYLINRDGLSNSYTDQMYRYAPRATCSMQNPTCGSPYLFCDTRGFPHCVPKIKFNGNCRTYEMYDSCYQGRCWWGRCVQAPATFLAARARAARTHRLGGNATVIELPGMGRTAIPRPPLSISAPLPVLPEPSTKPTPAASQLAQASWKTEAPMFIDCYNRHPCCDRWSKEGLCISQPEWMSQYCQASCEVCSPNYDAHDQCADRHPSCGAFKQVGMCSGASRRFMQENCRSACGFCGLEKETVCEKNGELIPIPASKEVVNSIRFSFDKDAERKIEALETAFRRRQRRHAP